MEAIGACSLVTVLWAWPLPHELAALQQAMRQAQAELYQQARMLNAVPLGPATYRVALRAVFDTHVGPALVAEVKAARLPEESNREGTTVPARCTAAMKNCGHGSRRGGVA
ncbi:hypothetical protein JMF97_28580 [Micromonospora fiedleri]|uniref:Uncharacterized protein n=1 Tax=Micromonospora fiedleri TaxID=1157498 RepID=A0ABS1UVB6_9ACTN|nr:hypothetical protein [Micromonospora fiedleri]MBL6280124.1 hypothetical protein [Micromonospora fiedleri]